MAKNNKGDSTAAVVGLGMLAALSAGAYYLYGTKEGSTRRVKIRGWVLKAKGEVMDRLENLKDVNQDTYNALVDTVLKKYESVKSIDQGEVVSLVADLKKHWKNIKRNIDAVSKPKATVKKTVKRVSKKIEAK